MRMSRAPEHRGGARKLGFYMALILGVVIVGSIIAYFTTGFGPQPATGAQAEPAAMDASPAPVQPKAEIAPPVAPAPKLELQPLEPDPAPPVVEQAAPGPVAPKVDFGEVLAEGFTEVKLPQEANAQVWYTYQVDTVARDITLFYVIYEQENHDIARTVKIEGYTQGSDVDNAHITYHYPGGYSRDVIYDGGAGTIHLTQQYDRTPYGPTMFTSDLRVALVNQGMQLADESGNVRAVLQLDLTGLSNSGQLVFQRVAPDLVGRVLLEIQDTVVQIDDQRPR